MSGVCIFCVLRGLWSTKVPYEVHMQEILKSLCEVCKHCVRQAALLFHCHIFGFSLVARLGLVMCRVSCCSSLLRPGAQVLWTLLCAGIALLTPFIESML